MPTAPATFETAAPLTRAAAQAPAARWKIKRRELTFILRNLATLIDSGVTLPKALQTIARERSLKKHAGVLETIRRKIESGTAFSTAITEFPQAFNEIIVNQIRVGERIGALVEALGRVTAQLEAADKIRSQVMRKLSYPAVLLVAGGIAVTFMLLFVVPVFEKTYAEAKVALPFITQALITAGQFLATYGLALPIIAVLAVIALRQARRTPATASAMDRQLLKLPIFGPWLRDLAVLDFMDALGNLLESGFTVAEALHVSVNSVRNRAVRQSVQELQAAVNRGERFSRELDRQGDLFPPVVSQLVIVGEKTGGLPKATAYIREHLRREIERTTNALVGVIEPVLTIGLAALIAMILLAIYLPMFDMIGAVAPPGN